jgi:hypothetical protein
MDLVDLLLQFIDFIESAIRSRKKSKNFADLVASYPQTRSSKWLNLWMDFIMDSREKAAIHQLRRVAAWSNPGDKFILQFGSAHQFEKYTKAGNTNLNISRT